MNNELRKKKQSKSSPLKVRITGYKLKPEQVHKNVKAYDRHKIKKEVKELLKSPENKTD